MLCASDGTPQPVVRGNRQRTASGPSVSTENIELEITNGPGRGVGEADAQHPKANTSSSQQQQQQKPDDNIMVRYQSFKC